MSELIRQYWQPYLFGSPGRPTGLVITLWLTVVSVAFGFILAIPLAVARVSKNRWLSLPVWIYTYVIRGTPLYVQLLLIYTGIYSLDAVRATPVLNAFFRDAMNCTILAFMLNTAAYSWRTSDHCRLKNQSRTHLCGFERLESQNDSRDLG